MKKRTLAIIAGAGSTPEKAAMAAKKAGHKVVFIAISETETLPLANVDAGLSISLLKVGSIIESMNEHDCDGVLLVGKFDKGLHNLDFSQMDETAGQMMAKLPGRGDMDIGKLVLDEIELLGFEAVSQLEAFANNVAPKGHIAGPEIGESRFSDVELGLKIARAVAGFDIGQTVVLKEGLVVAVEGAEHSDKCIARAGELVPGEKCVVKVARPKQDFRFDTPVVGTETLQTMAKAQCNLLVIEAGRCLIMDNDFNELAEKLKISVLAVNTENKE